jgi:hypothetical protein
MSPWIQHVKNFAKAKGMKYNGEKIKKLAYCTTLEQRHAAKKKKSAQYGDLYYVNSLQHGLE